MEQVKVDFKKLKVVPLAGVLEKYGISLKGSGAQLSADCPLPSHTSKDSKGSFKVNAESNVWGCKSDSCVAEYQKILGKNKNGKPKEGGDSLDLVRLMEKLDILSAAKKLLEWFPEVGEKKTPPTAGGAKGGATPKSALPSDSTPAKEAPQENKPLGFELRGIVYCDYLQKRGVSLEVALKFGIGFFPGKGSMAGRVVIPIRDENGALVAYAGRSISDEEPKYRFPNGFHKGRVLYNRHAVSGDVCVVVEGFFDCLAVSSAGFPCVALMGRTLSDVQEKLLTFKRIALMLDNDEPGQESTKELVLRLAKEHYVRIVEVKGQPDLMTPEEIKTALRLC